MLDRVQRHVFGAGLIFLTAVCSVMLGMAFKQDQMLRRQTYDQAAALHDLVIVARGWNAGHGGLFVRSAGGLEKITPEIMTRELSTLAASQKRFSLHITSLKLMNPSNAPDPWERRALTAFDRGERERFDVDRTAAGLRYRLMKPLYVERSCLACHAAQGYRLGDVRGGISVSLPFDEVSYALRRNFAAMITLAVALLLLFVLTLYFLIWRLMDQLSRTNKDLDLLNQTKDRFIGMAAHDLRNPLTSVVGFAEVIREETSDRSQDKLLENIIHASDRMLGLINDILDVSKISQGRLDLERRDVAASELIAQALEANAPIARRKNVALEAEIAPDAGSAWADPARMLQVLDNLIGNALKYSKPGGRVVIGARREETVLALWVRDRGVGIKREELSKLFQDFSRTSSRPTAGESSHGLGLAIAKRLVEMHGGALTVASEYGAGSEFTVRLPIKP